MSSTQRPKRTGVNSAYRRMLRDRQDNRIATAIGVALGILFVIAAIVGNRETERDPLPTTSDMRAMEDAADNPLRNYASGMTEGIDEAIDGDSGH